MSKRVSWSFRCLIKWYLWHWKSNVLFQICEQGWKSLFKIDLCTLFLIHDHIQKVKQKTKHLWVIHCRALGSVAIFQYMICFSAENQPSQWKPLQQWLLSLNFEIESDKSAKTRTERAVSVGSALSLSLSRISFWPGLVFVCVLSLFPPWVCFYRIIISLHL